MTALFDKETVLKAYLREEKEESREEGRIQGRIQGRTEGRKEGVTAGRMQEKKETVLRMSEMGMPLEHIARAVRVSLETIKDWLSEVPVVAK